MNPTSMEPLLRIGELSRRTGVSPELLRAWERRYGLFNPTRSDGGFRLYSSADEARIRRMKELLAQGLSAAQAAAICVAPPQEAPVDTRSPGEPVLADITSRLSACLDDFDGAAAEAVLDQLFSAFTLERALDDVVLPYLRDLGRRWEEGTATIEQEHFASNLLRSRLLSLGKNWSAGSGPTALLACLPGERHDLGLVGFGLGLRNRGWRITFLGADTPIASIVKAATELRPDLVVLVAGRAGDVEDSITDLREVARSTRVAIGGRGASADLAAACSATFLDRGPVGSVDLVAGG